MFAEDDEHRTTCFQRHKDSGRAILLREDRGGFEASRVRPPELGLLASDAERADGRQTAGQRIGHEIEVRGSQSAVDVTQVGPAVEIWPDTGPGQKTLRRDAPDDAAESHAMFLDLLTVAITPEFTGKSLHGLVAPWITAQAWRAYGAWPHDRGAGLDQVLDLAQQSESHGGRFRQHKQAIAHAVGQHEPPIADGHACQYGLR